MKFNRMRQAAITNERTFSSRTSSLAIFCAHFSSSLLSHSRRHYHWCFRYASTSSLSNSAVAGTYASLFSQPSKRFPPKFFPSLSFLFVSSFSPFCGTRCRVSSYMMESRRVKNLAQGAVSIDIRETSGSVMIKRSFLRWSLFREKCEGSVYFSSHRRIR